MLGEGFAQGRLNIRRALDFHADMPIRLGQFHEIRQGVDIRFGIAVAVKHLLPLADHPQVAVIEIDDLDRQAELPRSR